MPFGNKTESHLIAARLLNGFFYAFIILLYRNAIKGYRKAIDGKQIVSFLRGIVLDALVIVLLMYGITSLMRGIALLMHRFVSLMRSGVL